MNMQKLQNKLKNDLLKQSGLEMKKSAIWELPINRVELSFTTVKRSKMDVLMKMIMISLQKMHISSSDHVASFLNVDPLFVEGIIAKLQSTSMIRKNEGHYFLTDTGTERLQSGVYESPPEANKKRFLYSPCHQELIGLERDFESAEKKKTYRFLDQTLLPATSLEEETLIEALRTTEDESPEETKESMQVFINHVDPPKVLEAKYIQCIEFHLLDKQEHRSFTRVWNTLLDQWDVRLEEQIGKLGQLK